MAKNKTTFGLTLSNRALVTRGTQPKNLIDMAVSAEATGSVDAIWVGDSFLSKPRLECIPLLGAIAARTSHVKLGVACMATVAQRNPVLLALQWASLDVLSGGRTWLVACMGYPASQHPMAAKEFEVMGRRESRAPRTAERDDPGVADSLVGRTRKPSRQVLFLRGRESLTQARATALSDLYRRSPRTAQIGERGVERSLRRIARYADGWMSNQIEVSMFRDHQTRLRELLVEEGRYA